MKVLALVFIVIPAFGACLPVTGSRIFGRDLAQADSRFSVLPATLAVGFAPAPGTKRVFTARELERILRANGIAGAVDREICFEVPLRRLTVDEASAAMQRGLPAGSSLTIEELIQSDLPAGEAEFPLSGLEPAPPGTQGVQMWRGFVRYADSKKASCWARVKLSVHYTAVVATKDLAEGQTLEPALLRLEAKTGPLEHELAAISIEQVRGRALKRPVPAGSPVPLAILVEPVVIHRGDTIRVEVRSGPARLHFDAVADAPAHEGDLIELRNPLNGKTFKARVGKDRQAVVVIGGEEKL
jgi:flagella basal body P-ring formation protein FlgA